MAALAEISDSIRDRRVVAYLEHLAKYRLEAGARRRAPVSSAE